VKLPEKNHVWLLRHKLTRQVLQRCIVKKLTPDIESDTRPINFFIMPLWPKNLHIFGLDLEKLGFVVSKWNQTVTMSLHRFSVPERRDFLKNSGILQLMGKVSFAHSQ
jgi:hypothetical protein